jgi:hypothetical protein
MNGASFSTVKQVQQPIGAFTAAAYNISAARFA